MDIYKKKLKVWNNVVVYTNVDPETLKEFGYIELFEPKGKNEFTCLIKEFPLNDIDRVIGNYSAKIMNIKD